MHADGTSSRPRRDLYKKARWQPVVPEPRPAFICTFLSIFRADQKTAQPVRPMAHMGRASSHRREFFFSRDADTFPSFFFHCHRRCHHRPRCNILRYMVALVSSSIEPCLSPPRFLLFYVLKLPPRRPILTLVANYFLFTRLTQLFLQ